MSATTTDDHDHDLVIDRPLTSQRRLFKHIVSLKWIDSYKAACLFEGGRKFAAVDLRGSHFGTVDWELGFSHAFDTFEMIASSGRDSVRVLGRDKQRTYPLPGKKTEHITLPESPYERPSDPIETSWSAPRNADAVASMLPVKIKRAKKPLAMSKLDAILVRLPTLDVSANQTQEVPKLLRAESDSPMPFLSPAIPAKRALQTTSVLPQSEALVLPGSEPEGYFGSFSSNTFHDSDSDDDIFGLKESKMTSRPMGTGLNVPHPRPCGAVFSASGALVIFRPPKIQPAAKDVSLLADLAENRADYDKTSRLFPSFGNLLASVQDLLSINAANNVVVDALGLDKASYNSRESWRPHSLSAVPVTQPPVLQSVRVSVQEIDGIAGLGPQYRILTHEDESGAALCLYNATIASASSPGDTLIWQMLSKVVDETSAAERWTNHPLGASWLVRNIYAAAEAQGSLKMLACITAVLIGSADSGMFASMGTLAQRLPIPRTTKVERHDRLSAVPVVARLRTDISNDALAQQSPLKTRTNSSISSRNPSLPTTPRLESSSSTPPWSFAPFSTKSSFTKSVSPENTRGSFSAAVKSYAQSVSDKFASYGTSPPIKKSGLSPDFSSSLSSANASWTKSVSFASTTLTRRSSTLGNDSAYVDDESDSDRTVEDMSAPARKASISNTTTFTWKTRDAFSDELFGEAQALLIPNDILSQCVVWTRAYAEQLRCLGQHLFAVKFDKVGSVLAKIIAAEEHTDLSSNVQGVHSYTYWPPSRNKMNTPSADEARTKGNALYKSGRIVQAIEQYLKAHELAPEQSPPLANLAAAYYELGDYAQSITFSDRALALIQRDVSTEDSRARLLLRKVKSHVLLQDYTAAAALLKDDVPQSLAASPEWTSLSVRLGRGRIAPSDQKLSPFKPVINDKSQSKLIGEDKPFSLFDSSLLDSGRDEITFLYANPNDGRNVFATLQHIARPAISRPAKTRFRFTIADDSAQSVARLLVLLFILEDRGGSDVSLKTSKLLAALFYAYMAPVMPAMLSDIVRDYIVEVRTAIAADTLPARFSLDPAMKDELINVLTSWSSEPTDAGLPKKYCQKIESRLQQVSSLDDLEYFPAALKEEAKVYRRTGMLRSSLSNDSAAASIDELSRLSNEDTASHLDRTQTWTVNPTLMTGATFDLDDLAFDPFDFGSKISTSEISGSTSLADLISTWLLSTAKALHTLRDSAFFTFRKLSSIVPLPTTMTTPAAPNIQQSTYDRVHLTDLPDVVGGTLYVYLYALPLLRPHPSSYVTWKCTRWSAAFTTWIKYDVEYLALDPAKQDEIRKLFGVKPGEDLHAQNASSELFDSSSISGYRRARLAPVKLKYEELLSRAQTTTWLYRILLKTVLPHINDTQAGVTSPFNLCVFTKLVARLHALGYPAHWLSDVVETILNGTIRTTARPPATRPLRIKEVTSTLVERTQNLSFCSAELKRILATDDVGFGMALMPAATENSIVLKIPAVPTAAHVTGSLVLLLESGRTLEEDVENLGLVKRRTSQLAESEAITVFHWNQSDGLATFRQGQPRSDQQARVRLWHAESWTPMSHAVELGS